MSKLELTNNHFINSKLDQNQLHSIYNCFEHDYTASKTAQKIGLSRQTINSYYKKIRDKLIEEEEEFNNITLNDDFSLKSFSLKYIILHSQVIYYIEHNYKQYLLNTNNVNLKRIHDFVQYQVKLSLMNHTKANTAKILYDSYKKEYFISSYLKSSSELNTFIDNRLKKFRGLNKTNCLVHIQESIIRFNKIKI
jgi:DNA-binding XRE family transcriptional regulator